MTVSSTLQTVVVPTTMTDKMAGPKFFVIQLEKTVTSELWRNSREKPKAEGQWPYMSNHSRQLPRRVTIPAATATLFHSGSVRATGRVPRSARQCTTAEVAAELLQKRAQCGFRSLGESTIGESRELHQDYRHYLRKPPWTPPLPIHLNIYLYFYYFRILVKYFIH